MTDVQTPELWSGNVIPASTFNKCGKCGVQFSSYCKHKQVLMVRPFASKNEDIQGIDFQFSWHFDKKRKPVTSITYRMAKTIALLKSIDIRLMWAITFFFDASLLVETLISIMKKCCILYKTQFML